MPILQQVSIHGRRVYVSDRDILVGRGAIGTGSPDKPAVVLPGSNDFVAVFDDFLGDLVADEWAYVEGDTGYDGALTTAANGVFRIIGSETQAVAPTSAAALTGGLFKNWKPNSGGPKNSYMRMTARVKQEIVSRSAEAGRTHFFIGFSDSGGAEMPVYDTGAGMISNAADLMGFVFSPGGDTGWSLVSAKSTAADSGDQLVVSGTNPTANTYTTLELEYRSGVGDTGGQVHFWIDGVKKGRIDSPVNSATALTPWIGGWIQDTGAAVFMDVDYVNIVAARDTGF